MDIKTATIRTGAAALLACSVLLTGCYGHGPGYASDRHPRGHHDGDEHHDDDHDHDGDHDHHD